MKLPVEFLNKMKSLLGEQEYEEFLQSYEKSRFYGLRVNSLKISVEEFKRISPFSLEPVPWTSDGFYYPEGESPGRHPFYYAGLYYIQEPSAMLPGAVINAQPGDKVLDLCAAPGGKTVQMAAGMKGQGILVSNDISTERVKALVKNIELAGITNAVVTNDSPDRLANNFAEYFDKILIDAPCSGEGMFRKDEDAAKSWEKFKCQKCACMQWDILRSIDRMLKPGGNVVYSTCTFSPEEDEQMISAFLKEHDNYEFIDIQKIAGIAPGRPDWSDGNPELEKTARLWPHRIKGEGHYVAMLHKKGKETDQNLRTYTQSENKSISLDRNFNKKKLAKPDEGISEKDLIQAFREFAEENLNIDINGNFIAKGNNLYCLPAEVPDLSGIKVAKFGWYLGAVNNGRFEPSHSMIVSLKNKDLKRTINFPAESKEVFSYLKGETLMIEGEKGFCGVCADGYTLGWAKQTGDMLKNLYPKGWRKMS
ncbi:MAG: RsmB/NOP family class I SAM-dependent RNA methyltransferase [Clostridia bacterium]|nr:RsmB/NOP family class I SAM-dependent RNA methyltransferase [Clostridia bacterium]